jgi:hypothetical protein
LTTLLTYLRADGYVQTSTSLLELLRDLPWQSSTDANNTPNTPA